jgi:hypothetical protein
MSPITVSCRPGPIKPACSSIPKTSASLMTKIICRSILMCSLLGWFQVRAEVGVFTKTWSLTAVHRFGIGSSGGERPVHIWLYLTNRSDRVLTLPTSSFRHAMSPNSDAPWIHIVFDDIGNPTGEEVVVASSLYDLVQVAPGKTAMIKYKLISHVKEGPLVVQLDIPNRAAKAAGVEPVYCECVSKIAPN